MGSLSSQKTPISIKKIVYSKGRFFSPRKNINSSGLDQTDSREVSNNVFYFLNSTSQKSACKTKPSHILLQQSLEEGIVVSKGIAGGLMKPEESPHYLLNVVITLAKEQ